jgi:peptide/nickel transport system substrate-binding protein
MLDSTDYSFISSGAKIAADLMTKLGMNVDLQSMDFPTLLQRRTSKEPVERGGWSMFSTVNDLLSLQNPGINFFVRGWVGGYSNEEINKLTEQWLAAANPLELQKISEQIQKLSFEDVPFIPLGQWQGRNARRKNLTGVVAASTPVFWGVKRA